MSKLLTDDAGNWYESRLAPQDQQPRSTFTMASCRTTNQDAQPPALEVQCLMLLKHIAQELHMRAHRSASAPWWTSLCVT